MNKIFYLYLNLPNPGAYSFSLDFWFLNKCFVFGKFPSKGKLAKFFSKFGKYPEY